MEEKEHSFIQNLWDRRFIQFGFSYLLGVFGLVQFVEWTSKRYFYSPLWPDVVLVFLLLLLPAVLLFIYHHGKPGGQPLQRSEKIWIPVNLLLAVLSVVFLFKGNNRKEYYWAGQNDEGVLRRPHFRIPGKPGYLFPFQGINL